jgi:hypothetical protein
VSPLAASRTAKSASSAISPASPPGPGKCGLSRGYVEARSPNPAEAPAINLRYLSDPTDRRAIVGGLRFIRRLFAAPTLARQLRRGNPAGDGGRERRAARLCAPEGLDSLSSDLHL